MMRRQILTVVIALLMCAGCSSTGAWSRYELCFGLSADSGKTVISDQQWQEFRDEMITPRFFEGYTVFEAEGHWRSGAETFTEPSKILMVVAPDSKDTQNKLDDIMNAYIQRFRQDAVLQIKSPAEITFRE